MKRYCPKCRELVETTPNWRHYEECAKCGELPLYTLRQQWFLECFFEAHLHGAYSVSVRKDMFNRSGQVGFYDSVTSTGLNVFFDERPTGVEAWKWAELETEHLFPRYDESTAGLDILDDPVNTTLAIGDRFMRADGEILIIEAVEGDSDQLSLRAVNLDNWDRLTLAANSVREHFIVDFLSVVEQKELAARWVNGVCPKRGMFV